MKQKGFFDEEDCLKKLSGLGDPLEKLNEFIEWEDFRGILVKALKKEAQGPGGRPPFDYVMMFKILILQKLYNMADDKTEFQINDRFSFRRFLGMQLYDTVPDAKTIWNFREELKSAEIIERLFDLFTAKLEKESVITYSGSIVDASFVEVPRQRNTKKRMNRLMKVKLRRNGRRKKIVIKKLKKM